MPENKDELLKKQNEEIQKLKKELKQASKPSSMFSVLKNTVKRNVHDFFIREDRMKNMDSKIKNLEKELAKKEEELTGSILPEGTEEELMAGEAEEE